MVAKRKVVRKRAVTASEDTFMDTPIVSQARNLPTTGSVFSKGLPIIYLALLLLAFGFGVLWQKVDVLEKNPSQGAAVAQGGAQPQATAGPLTTDQVKDLFSQDLIKFGDANKKVLLVEVADPSCPYCHIAGGKNPELNKQAGAQFLLKADGGTYVAPVPEMKKLVDEGKAGYVYIYTPGHGSGEMGQKALYCAYEKGKFWQAHDLLYSAEGYTLMNDKVKNDKAQSGAIADFLKSAVPAADMKACLDSGKYDARISSDTTLAQSLAVYGTPGFFVNTARFAGAYSYTDMESAVTAALNQ